MVAAFLVSVEEPRRLLLLRRGSSDSHAPGVEQILYGHIESGESAIETLLRELGEETGLNPHAIYSLNETFTFYNKYTGGMSLTPLFLLFVSAEDPVDLDPAEHSSAEWVPFDSARSRLVWPAQRRAFDILVDLLENGLPELMRLEVLR